jgi:DNA-binding transcriptional LysR family regulator
LADAVVSVKAILSMDTISMTDITAPQLGQIQAFVEVARHGTISRAAEALFVSQPALTARIQGLERTLGSELFARGRHGSRLTEAGSAFLPYAERALTTVQRGREAVAEVASGNGGRLTIGAAPAVSTYVLPSMLHRFQADHPGIRLSVRSGHSEDVLEMVLREEVEIGLMRPIHHAEVISSLLYEDELVLVVHHGHPFASSGPIRMERMATENLILFDRTSSYHELTSAVFRQAGIAPRGYLEVDNIDAAKRMVEQRLGIALLPRTSIVAEIGNGRLSQVEITDMAPLKRQIVVTRRRDGGDMSPAAAAFLGTLDGLRPNEEPSHHFLA